MRETVGPDMGVKASGGVHNAEEALAMIEAGQHASVQVRCSNCFWRNWRRVLIRISN